MKKPISKTEIVSRRIEAGRAQVRVGTNVERDARVSEARERSEASLLHSLRKEVRVRMFTAVALSKLNEECFSIVDKLDHIGLEVLLYNLSLTPNSGNHESLIDRLEKLKQETLPVGFIKAVEFVLRDKLREHFEDHKIDIHNTKFLSMKFKQFMTSK